MTQKITTQILTPLMKQYKEIKSNYPDAILLFRLGDFYEMFGEDALKCAPILNIVLTKRQNIPMCGVPYHSVNTYISKLINQGYKVAICEQLEEASKSKKLIKRDVIRIITPGTILEDNLLDEKSNNYLMSIYSEGNYFGIAYLDISTGEFFCSEFKDDTKSTKINSEISRINPNEFLIPQSFDISLKTNNKLINRIDDYFYTYNFASEKILSVFNISSLMSFGLQDYFYSVCACGGILAYLEKTQKEFPKNINSIKYYSTDEYMLLDESAIRSLELLECSFTKTKENSLLEILDKTKTSLGARLLKKNLIRPLINIEKINQRLDIVEFFYIEGILRKQIRDEIIHIKDIERILSRSSSKLITPPEVILLKNSLKAIPTIKNKIKQTIEKYTYIPTLLNSIIQRLHELPELISTIEQTLIDDPPNDISKGGFIKQNYNPELDELRKISIDTKSYIASLEKKERERTGIQSLKIGYTSVFGYYIEVTKPNLSLVPQDYIRKQTLVNAERFITPELKNLEEKIISADEKIIEIEITIFKNLVENISNYSNKLKEISEAIAELDLYTTLSEVAVEYNYIKPKLTEENILYIREGRHPIIEAKFRKRDFIPNDTYLEENKTQMILLTGPNMAGKSTYLRQVALIVILAHMGSFVPAKEAIIGITDRIFTRIGSADYLSAGASTFMIEMQEVSNIINNSTPRSLLILDEVGRGTSTYDGIAIAWATIEYILNKGVYGPKVLFATHYFELTDLAEKYPKIKNMNMAVKEYKDEIIFLYKVTEGASDKSYGIHVAKLAGLPKEIILRAKKILNELQLKADLTKKALLPEDKQQTLPFTSTHPLIQDLKEINIENLTPIEALNILNQLKEKYTKDDI